MGESKAPSTWDGLSSTILQFERFDFAQTDAAYTGMPLDWRMAFWIEHKVQKGELNRSSPGQYAKWMQQVYYEVYGDRSVALRDFAAGLRRRPGAAPDGASPIPVSQLRNLLARSEFPDLYYQVLLQWLTASRTDDMNRLTSRDLAPQADGATFAITWTATKTGLLPSSSPEPSSTGSHSSSAGSLPARNPSVSKRPL
jgi:hypothetical protein